MTTLLTTMFRLGAVLTGTNEDLELTSSKSEGEGTEGEGDGSEDSEEEEEGAGDSDDENEDEADDTDEDGEPGNGDSDDDGDEDSEDESEDESGGDSDDDSDDEGDEDSKGGDTDDSDDSDDDGDTGGESNPNEGEDDTEGDDSDGDSDDPGDDGDGGEGSDQEGGDNQSDGEGAGVTEGADTDDGTFELAQDLLDAFENEEETGLTDNNDALGKAIGDEHDDEEILAGERIWRPYNPGNDVVRLVQGGDVSKARALKAKVRKEISALQSQLRSKFLQARRPQVVHGVRKGLGLTERRLVSTVVEIRSGRTPTRPDWQRVNKEECSLAAAVVLDESSSMGRRLAMQAGAAALAIAVPLDKLGSPCLVVGSRDGGHGYDYEASSDPNFTDDEGLPRYHRTGGVTIDVFKDWDESMLRALPRFSRVQSTGGTPLSDGIQYALTSLSYRPERHRIVFVVTDGWPDNQAVVTRQIRIAREAGVHIVGVGISSGCTAVKGLFPTHVSVHNLAELPKEMMKILSAIMFPKHGKRIHLDGKFTDKRTV